MDMLDLACWLRREAGNPDGQQQGRPKSFSADARRDAGYQLDKLQRGEDPDAWKPMRSVGRSVREIRIHEESGAFRVIFLAARPEGVYVLH